MRKILISCIAGLVMFVWGFISWQVLPWHNTDVESFNDEQAVMSSMLAQAPASAGIYYIPSTEADLQAGKPVAYVSLLKNGHRSGQGAMIAIGLLCNIALAFLAICLLQYTRGLGFVQIVGFVSLLGLIIGLGGYYPFWNWFGFPTGYSLVLVIDSVVTWLLGGLVIAKMLPRSN